MRARAPRLLCVFQNRRWDSDFLFLQQLLASGELGDIVEFESRFDRFRPQVRPRWREADVAGAGLWYDLGPHLVDQALLLFGPPQAVSAELLVQRAGAQATDAFRVQLHYARLSVQLGAGMLVSGGTPRFLLQGTRGACRIDGLDAQEGWLKQGVLPGGMGWGPEPRCATLFTADGEHTSSQLRELPLGDYAQFYPAVMRAVQGAGQPPVTCEQMLAVMQIIDAAHASHAAGGARIALPV